MTPATTLVVLAGMIIGRTLRNPFCHRAHRGSKPEVDQSLLRHRTMSSMSLMLGDTILKNPRGLVSANFFLRKILPTDVFHLMTP